MKREKALYTQVDPTKIDLQELIKTTLGSGAKELHLGWTRCWLCGEEIEPEVIESELKVYGPNGVIVLHLCSECWYRIKGWESRC